ncbi:hypothetical protein HNQ71_006730 [Mesorhizobium sangaii]|uniref:Uncharacterized protein n=1 Tax=Mesorhizobium sangaii TaxID=505389 RepID=A0A841PJ53_9HYPH|nr:hypothetical protein [Mesorhizobium sangaii]
MIQIKAELLLSADHGEMWKPILSAPFGRNLELAVFDADGEHALVFACRKVRDGWTNAVTGARIDIHPTHWRDWEPGRALANATNPLRDSP